MLCVAVCCCMLLLSDVRWSLLLFGVNAVVACCLLPLLFDGAVAVCCVVVGVLFVTVAV